MSQATGRAVLAREATDQLFEGARTHDAWRDEPVGDDVLLRAYELAKWGPTSANTCPLRIVFVRSSVAKGQALVGRRGTESREDAVGPRYSHSLLRPRLLRVVAATCSAELSAQSRARRRLDAVPEVTSARLRGRVQAHLTRSPGAHHHCAIGIYEVAMSSAHCKHIPRSHCRDDQTAAAPCTGWRRLTVTQQGFTS
jgi:hypothetical protein